MSGAVRSSGIEVRPSPNDPSGLREIQQRLFQAERMASLGALAASVAHEVNNPLTYVLANLSFILDQLSTQGQDTEGAALDRASLVEAARDALQGAERVRVVIRDMHAVSRGDIDALGPTDVHAAIDAALRVTSHLMRRRATVQTAYETVPRVTANEGLLVQVFMNLLTNAAQAMGPSLGQVTVSTRSPNSGTVVVEVQDNGEGIEEALIPRIYEPFFTTRDPGTGLGLFTVQGIVDTLGGHIECESEKNRGTVFRVHLPAAVSRAELQTTDNAPRPFAARSGRKLRVLLVDDESHVRAALGRMLSVHDVAFCADASRALALSRSCHFDVLLSDLVMPGESGRELHQALLREGNPLAAHTVFLTGGALDPEDARYIQDGRPCLFKPVDRESLLDALEAAAGESADYALNAVG